MNVTEDKESTGTPLQRLGIGMASVAVILAMAGARHVEASGPSDYRGLWVGQVTLTNATAVPAIQPSPGLIDTMTITTSGMAITAIQPAREIKPFLTCL